MAADSAVAWQWMEGEDECTWQNYWQQTDRSVDEALPGGKHTALQTAVLFDYAALVRWLLRVKGADPLACPAGTDPPLIMAVGEGSTDSVGELLAFANSDDGLLARLLAVHTEQVDRVAHIGQAFSVYSPGGMTAFHTAVDRSRLDLLRLLVARARAAGLGAELGRVLLATNTAGQTATDLAVAKAVLATRPDQAERYQHIVQLLDDAAGATTTRCFPSRAEVEAQQQRVEAAMRERARLAERQALERRKQEGLVHVRTGYVRGDPHVYERLELASPDWLDALRKPVDDYGVWSAPALSPAYCARLFAELLHYERAAKQPGAQLPLYQRHDGNLGSLECCGFQPVIDMIHEQLMLPVLRRCFPHIASVRTRHAFLTRNWLGRDEVFRKHRDASDITLNICLQKSDGVQGSTVKFFSSEEPERVVLDYDHSLGHMVIHSGKEWHQTQELTGPADGQRSSLIVWADQETPAS